MDKPKRNTRPRPWQERFAEKVDVRGDGECWPWLGTVNKVTGYGYFEDRPAHRWAVEYATGEPVPVDMVVDHVRDNGCTRRDCVNWVSHLEVVTPRENVRRTVPAVCGRGHLYAESSRVRKNGTRMCVPCENLGQRERAKLRKKERDAQRGTQSERGPQ